MIVAGELRLVWEERGDVVVVVRCESVTSMMKLLLFLTYHHDHLPTEPEGHKGVRRTTCVPSLLQLTVVVPDVLLLLHRRGSVLLRVRGSGREGISRRRLRGFPLLSHFLLHGSLGQGTPMLARQLLLPVEFLLLLTWRSVRCWRLGGFKLGNNGDVLRLKWSRLSDFGHLRRLLSFRGHAHCCLGRGWTGR